MKNIFLVFAVLALAGTTFGQELKPSVGGGLGYTLDSQYYKLDGSLGGGYSEKEEFTNTVNYFKVGGFFDYTFVEASVALGFQLGKMHSHGALSITGGVGSGTSTQDSDGDRQFVDLDLRVLGKYPFTFGSFAIFPLAGLEYSLNVSAKDKDKASDSEKAELNDLFIDLGAGFDYAINDKFYFRAEALYGLNLTPASKSYKDAASAQSLSYADFGYRLNFVAAVGYNL